MTVYGYELWQHETSGEKFVTELNDRNKVTGVCGPLTEDEVKAWEVEPADAEYDRDDVQWFSRQPMRLLAMVDA